MFLGERLNFRLGRAFPSEISKSQIVSALQDVLRDGGLHAMKAESLLDLLSVPFPTVSLGRLYLRLFQWPVIKVVRHGRPLASWIPVTGVMARHLSRWTTPYALETGVEFRPPLHKETVFTDASL